MLLMGVLLCVCLQLSIWSGNRSIAAQQSDTLTELQALSQRIDARFAHSHAEVLAAHAKLAHVALDVRSAMSRRAEKSTPETPGPPAAVSSALTSAAAVELRAAEAQDAASWTGPPAAAQIKADEEKLNVIRAAAKHAWAGYARYGFGSDELKPVSNMGHDWMKQGATIVDSLDTLWLMGLNDEWQQARDWVASQLNFDADIAVSFFETTIRCLGGLIAAYELSGDTMFLEKARILGSKLLHAFTTPIGFPMAQINLKSLQVKTQDWLGNAAVLAEVGTFQLEFEALSRHTGDAQYSQKAQQVFSKLASVQPASGLYPLFVDINTGAFQGDQISFGAMGDSFYEYTLKVWLYSGKKDNVARSMYRKAADGLLDRLVFDTNPSQLVYVAEMQGGSVIPKMDHLACFVPGLLALGARHLNPTDRVKHMKVAEGVARTCHEMSARQATGVAPEFISIVPGNDFVNGASHNLLRPEALESMFVLWRMTGDPKYRQWGWDIFNGFERSCKTSSGYSGLSDVTQQPAPMDDMQQSFFIAETLKYAYLLFSAGDVLPLDKYVFNTEAHPLKI